MSKVVHAISNLWTLSQLLKQRPSLSALKQVHAQVVVQSLSSYPPLISSLIHCYLLRQYLNVAGILFDNYPSSSSPPSLLWNLLIRAYSKHRDCLESIRYFARMLAVGGHSMVRPDDYTYTFVVTSCSHQSWLGYGQMVHGLIVRDGFGSGLYVGNALVNLYSVFGDMGSARKVFDQMSERDVFSWTSLLGGYAKRGEIDSACKVFDKMTVKNDVSCGVMISGLVSNEKYIEALNYFRSMMTDAQVKPNEAVLVCALSACAHLGALDLGKWIHIYVDRLGIGESSNICTALIDMYAKCGRIDCARQVFSRMQKRDVHNFTSMISGLSIHGLGKDAVELFYRMVDEDIRPNGITLLVVLNGCSHSGLVEEGTSIFNNIESFWSYGLKIEHYGSYVDLLGRAGHLEKAFEVVKSMPMEPDIVIWRALLSACRTHKNTALGEIVVANMSSLESGDYILLSNTFCYLQMWDNAAFVRDIMRTNRVCKDQGKSWVEVGGIVYQFKSGDRSHPETEAIYNILEGLTRWAKREGFVCTTELVFMDISEEEKEENLTYHSEKLAVSFLILKTGPGAEVRVSKNLRTCYDCHNWFKLVSRMLNRVIIVRDRIRFHRFERGCCSCGDYW